MKKLIILCSILFSCIALAETETLKVEVSEDKAQVQQQYSHYFGPVQVNTRIMHSYRITNTGSVPLYFQDARVYGTGFYARQSCGGVLNPGRVCMVYLEFAPWFEGYHNGQFALWFDRAEIIINLAGQGVRY